MRPPAVLLAAFALAWPLALLMPATSARADRDRSEPEDHDRARQAVQAGQVLPLRTVLARLEREQAGQVMEVELEHDDGRWVYEIKLLKPDGRLVKLKLDARTATVLRLKPDGEHRAPH
jgi:uncharacterized membrane protein YkoI